MGCGCNGGGGSNEINTQTCQGASNCPQAVATVSCGCGCSPCQCGQKGTLPTPYYNQAPGVEECHKQVVIQQSFVTAISTVTAFNMPACNTTAVITIPGLTKMQVGSYIWNVTFGYLLVVGFDYVNQQVTVKNECTAGNAAPGTAVPACTMFNVVDPPGIGGGGGQIGVFLATDFVAPANGNCIDINVTGVAGLTVGSNVQVSSGIYLLSAIVSPTIITICNEGSGVIHGTVVVALDGSGQYIVPITPLSTNACLNAAQLTGALLTCHNGVQGPLEAAAVGQVPVVVDAGTNEVEFQNIQVTIETCATMTGCLNLIAGTTIYTIVVDDSSVFVEGQLLVIHVPAYETDRWTITDIPDGFHVTIEKTTPQTVSETIGCDTAQVCLAPCCEQITTGAAICSSDWSSAFKSDSQTGAIDVSAELSTTNVAPFEFKSTGDTALTITNPTCNDMHIIANIEYYMTGHVGGEPGAFARYHLDPFVGVVEDVIGGVLVPVPTSIIQLRKLKDFGSGAGADPCSANTYDEFITFAHSFVYVLPPNRQLVMYASALITYVQFTHYVDSCCHPCVAIDSGDGKLTIEHLVCKASMLGVAVQAA